MRIKPPSQFVIPGVDIKDGDWIRILNEGEYRTLPQNPDRKVLVFEVQLPSGNKKFLTMNATSQKALIREWGDDSKNWVNKRVKVEIVKQQVFDRKKDVIYLHPPEAPEEIKPEDIPL